MTDRQSGQLRRLEALDFSRVRLHYKALYVEGIKGDSDAAKISEALMNVKGVSAVNVKEKFIEAILDDKSVSDEALRKAVENSGDFRVSEIE